MAAKLTGAVTPTQGEHRRQHVDQRGKRVGVSLAREQAWVREDERHVERLLVDVEHLLAQAAVRQTHLTVIGAAHDHRARSQRTWIVSVSERGYETAELGVDDPV